jgi:hypothetical protein
MVCDGATTTPSTFPLFCVVVVVRRGVGIPPISTVSEHSTYCASSLNLPDSTPPLMPGMSPVDIGILVPWLWAIPVTMKMIGTNCVPFGGAAWFTKGIGT